MSRNIQKDDFVIIDSTFYQISDIINSNIFVSPIDDPTTVYQINQKDGEWILLPSTTIREISFLSREEYNISSLSSKLLSLPPEIMIVIASKLPLNDISSLCKSNKYLNDVLCYNDNFWRIKYIHDIGQPSGDIKIEGKDSYFTKFFCKQGYSLDSWLPGTLYCFVKKEGSE